MADVYDYLYGMAAFATAGTILWNVYHRTSGQPDILPAVETAFKAVKATTTTASGAKHASPSLLFTISILGFLIASATKAQRDDLEEGIKEILKDVETQLQECHQRLEAFEVKIQTCERRLVGSNQERDAATEAAQRLQISLDVAQSHTNDLKQQLESSKLKLEDSSQHLTDSNNERDTARVAARRHEARLAGAAMHVGSLQRQLDDCKTKHEVDVEQLHAGKAELQVENSNLRKERSQALENTSILERQISKLFDEKNSSQSMLQQARKSEAQALADCRAAETLMENQKLDHTTNLRFLEAKLEACRRENAHLAEEPKALERLHQAKMKHLKQIAEKNAHAATSLNILKDQQRECGQIIEQERSKLRMMQDAYDAVTPELKSTNDAFAALLAEHQQLREEKLKWAAEKLDVQSSIKSLERKERKFQSLNRHRIGAKKTRKMSKKGPSSAPSTTLPLSPIVESEGEIEHQSSTNEMKLATTTASVIEPDLNSPPLPPILQSDESKIQQESSTSKISSATTVTSIVEPELETPPVPPTVEADESEIQHQSSTSEVPSATTTASSAIEPDLKTPPVPPIVNLDESEIQHQSSRSEIPPAATTTISIIEPELKTPPVPPIVNLDESEIQYQSSTSAIPPATIFSSIIEPELKTPPVPMIIKLESEVQHQSSTNEIKSATRTPPVIEPEVNSPPVPAILKSEGRIEHQSSRSEGTLATTFPITTEPELHTPPVPIKDITQQAQIFHPEASNPAVETRVVAAPSHSALSEGEPKFLSDGLRSLEASQEQHGDTGTLSIAHYAHTTVPDGKPKDDEAAFRHHNLIGNPPAAPDTFEHVPPTQQPTPIYDDKMEVDSDDPNLPCFSPSDYRSQFASEKRGHYLQVPAPATSLVHQDNSVADQRPVALPAAPSIGALKGANVSYSVPVTPNNSFPHLPVTSAPLTAANSTASAEAKQAASPKPELRVPTIDYWRVQCTCETEARKMFKQDMAKYKQKCKNLAA